MDLADEDIEVRGEALLQSIIQIRKGLRQEATERHRCPAKHLRAFGKDAKLDGSPVLFTALGCQEPALNEGANEIACHGLLDVHPAGEFADADAGLLADDAQGPDVRAPRPACFSTSSKCVLMALKTILN